MSAVAALLVLFAIGHLPDAGDAATLRAASEGQALSRLSSAQQSQTTLYLRKRKREHEANLERLMSNITLKAATDALRARRHPNAPAILAELTESHSSLRGQGSGLDNAKDLLNTMLEEVQEKYDLELDRCCDFAHAQSNLIEESRQDISFFSGGAAEARERILEAEQEIDAAKVKLPKLKLEMQQHEDKCEKEKADAKEELRIVLADISVMSMVLGLTDCEKSASSSQQTLLLLSCDCDGQEVVAFHDETLDRATRSLASTTAQRLLQESLTSSFASDLDVAESQYPSNGTVGTVTPAPVRDTPTPSMVKRSSPCKSPTATDKRTSKCSIKNNPNCERLQERFLLIQSGIKDKRDELLEQLSTLEKNCQETKDLYESQIEDLDMHRIDFETKLAGSTSNLNHANEQMRLKGKEFEEFKSQWSTETETCHNNYAEFESQECGLKKIRTELFKMQGGTSVVLFQDCAVSDWEENACSKTCETGSMILSRTIVAPPKNGMKCPPLSKSKPCNTHKCPIDCKMSDWEAWSSCSAECGGGVRERIRQVERRPRYQGEPCEETTESVACHAGACDSPCELEDWTAWGECSKFCGGGSQVRVKNVRKPATGSGTCAPMDSEMRQERRACHETPCLPKLNTLRCESKLDVVLLLDGSGSIGQRGWDATKDVGIKLANAFQSHHEDIKVASVLFSGPRHWHEIENCGGDAPPFGWTTMYAKGYMGNVPSNKDAFNDIFKKSHLGIVRRQCMWCRNTHRDIYFRRYTDASKFDAWDNLMVTWRDTGFHSDFDIFSTLSDALQGTNAWRACNGHDAGIGFPRDCGPYGLTGWQWQSLTRGGQRHLKWSALTKMEVDLEKDCNIKFINHFTNDTASIVKSMEEMQWPQGATLTALALRAAEEEVPLSGRPDAKSVVIVVTDGKPVGERKTELAAEKLREKARLLFVPVSAYAPRDEIEHWASTPANENVVDARTFEDLGSPKVINDIVSDVCEQVS